MGIAAQARTVNLPSELEYEAVWVRLNLTPIYLKLNLAISGGLECRSELEYQSFRADSTSSLGAKFTSNLLGRTDPRSEE